MSDNNNLSQEELSKLEEQACFELCQIIAEAMQTQDIELLDARIAQWKQKYKKLLDGSLPNSKFKKKIEFLLNQYYSSVTRYIQEQIKFKEHVKIENQSKALRKLYSIIKETNDLKTLKKKIKEWEKNYPYESFLKMYQKRITQYTKESNLKDNAFDQDQAFSDLVAITKLNRSFDEFKYELEKWEKNYSINNKYKLDDFLNNRNEVKRYTSDEYLLSISRDNNIDDKADDIDEKTGYTNINKQAVAYSALLSIASKPNNEAKMFEWVYKNRNIKFNDNYKELILAATYLDYSPTLLNKIKVPNTNLSKPSVSLEEYNNINKLKKYSIVSYFNLLLPTESRITNDFFNQQLLEIYNKSEKIKHKNSFKVETPSSKIEIVAPEKDEPKKEDKKINLVDNKENDIEIAVDESIINNENTVEIKLDNSVPLVKNEIEEEKVVKEKTIEEPVSEFKPVEIVSISPMFFEAVHRHTQQSEIIEKVNETADEYIEKDFDENEIDLNMDLQITKIEE